MMIKPLLDICIGDFLNIWLTWQELEYPDGHTSQSIYVAMPLESLSEKVSSETRKHLEGASLAIWTTTPWTIPANMAVAVNADLDYIVAEIEVWTQFQASKSHFIACSLRYRLSGMGKWWYWPWTYRYHFCWHCKHETLKWTLWLLRDTIGSKL